MSHRRSPSQKGSVLLVALCFVTVLGISLASYIAVCSRTMQISNRTAQTSLSRQLAEMGLEEALRAFNKNDWSDWSNGPAADWTISGTTATCNLTFPAGTFGQGLTGSVKIRVDNYNANQLSSTWSSSATYRIGDLVGSSGTWYRSLRNSNTNQTPSSTNLTWWAPNPMPWKWSSDRTYSQYEMVNYKGIWYRCIATPPVSAGTTTYAPQVPVPATTYWTPIPSQRAWASSTSYSVYDVVAYTDPSTSDVSLYRCITAHTSGASFSTDAAKWSSNVQTVSLAWSSGTVYTRGAMVYYVGASIYRWYYCIQSGTSSTIPSTDTTMWAPVWPDTSFPVAPVNGTSYSVGSYINYLDNCYLCTTAHTYSNWATSSGNWSNISSDTMQAGAKYYVGDYSVYGGTWYRCNTAHTYSAWGTDSGKWTVASPFLQLFYLGTNTLSTASNSIFYYAGSSWYRYMGGYVLALTGNMHAWVSGNKYNLGDAVYYSSKWYRCILAHTSSGTLTPTNTTYWATDPVFSTAWDSGKQFSANDTVRYNGVWYICISSHIGSATTIPTNTTYWIGANTSTAGDKWNPTTTYASGDYKCYGGAWYKCIAASTGQSPNNNTYWTASWANSFGVTTGAPVAYAEGTVNIPGSASIKTQLRATIASSPLFPNAAAANASTITANSGGTVDSYDSTTGTSVLQIGTAGAQAGTSNSIYGTYASHQNKSTNYSAVVASSYSAGTAITLSSTDVKGYLAAPSTSTTPYAPQYSSGGTVKGFTSPGSPNIDLTRISRSPYIPKFDTIPGGAGGLATNWSVAPKGTPISWTASPASTTLNLGTPGDTVPSRYYYNGNLTIGTATQNILRINGPVILYINGDLFITASGSTGRIDIASTGSAEIHVAGVFKADINGDGIQNYTSDPKSLTIICDTTSTSTHFYSEGLNDLYGVIYIPYSTSTTGYYNDNNNTEIFGAISANKITYSGANMNIHYDTSLRYATFGGVDQPYAITEWRELTDASELATMP